MLEDVFFQDGVGHAERLGLRIEVFLLQVITVSAVQVAEGTGGFDKDLKFTGSFGHHKVLTGRGRAGSGEGMLSFTAAFCPVPCLKLTILQDHSVDIFSAIDAFPRPEVFGLMINLLIDHHAAATITLLMTFPHPVPPWIEKKTISNPDLTIPQLYHLSMKK